MDLRDLWRPGGGASGLTYRMAQSFVDMLPFESATKTAIRDDMGEEKLAQLASQEPEGYGPWSLTDMRLAAVIDKLSTIAYAIYHAQGARPSMPPPYPRPGVVRERTTLTPAGQDYLTRLRVSIHASWEQQRAEMG